VEGNRPCSQQHPMPQQERQFYTHLKGKIEGTNQVDVSHSHTPGIERTVSSYDRKKDQGCNFSSDTLIA
jgi:hypothetical protein